MNYLSGPLAAKVVGCQTDEPGGAVSYVWVVTVWNGSDPITPSGGLVMASLSAAVTVALDAVTARQAASAALTDRPTPTTAAAGSRRRH